MASKPETVFKNRIRPLLESLPKTWVCKIQQVSLRGDPDIILCVNSRFVALELKKDKMEEPTVLQKYKLDKIRAAKGLSFVVTPENWDFVYKQLKSLACK